MALDKINSNGQTNATWRGVIDAGIDVLNNDILQASTTIEVTQSGNQSTTQCVVKEGSTTIRTYNASDYNNSAIQTIQTAIDSIPVNQSGYQLTILIGDETGQTIEISDQIRIRNFNGHTVVIKSAKASDNNTNSATKANKIQSEGTSLDRLISIFYNSSEVNIQGLELIQNTSSNTTGQFVITAGQSWVDISYCKFTGSGTVGNKYGVLSQRGANVYVRQSYFDNLRAAVITSNSGKIASESNQHTGTQPAIGAQAGNGIILLVGTQVSGSTADYYAASGGLITSKNGLILEETILTGARTVNIPAGTSVSDIQDIINDQPRNLNGYNLTFQFADGTYDFGTTQLGFTGFEGGTLIVKGSGTTNAAGAGLGVIIQSENTADEGAFFFQKCSRVNVNTIRFEQNGSNNDTVLLRFFYGTQGTVIDCSFANLNGTRRNRAVYYHEARGMVRGCKFNNFSTNVSSIMSSRVLSRDTATFSGSGNDQDATNNTSSGSGSIVTQSGTQAGGSASKSDGGVIFDTNGDIV